MSRGLKLAQEGQITNRFTLAIEQLGASAEGKPKLVARFGAIYALERLARDSPPDHWTIMEVLTAYVRQRAPGPPLSVAANQCSQKGTDPLTFAEAGSLQREHADMEAILTVLGRRTKTDKTKEGRIDLSRVDLRALNLTSANLQGAHMQDADLEGAAMGAANLKSAFLVCAHLENADFRTADLEGANLTGADLRGAKLDKAGRARRSPRSGARPVPEPPGHPA